MRSSEFVMVLLIGSLLLIAPVATLILSIIAYVRSRRINALAVRLAELERRIMEKESTASISTIAEPTAVRSPSSTKSARPADLPATPPTYRVTGPSNAALWETFIGQKAFGWIAVLLFVLASAFFLRYAYQNNWIGPIGRVSISELVGLGLVAAGWWYLREGLKLFSHMLTAAGISVMYLATYSAFGFYDLIPQHRAGIFLAILVLESMILAVVYRSSIIAWVSVVGGLATPLLMTSDIDFYSSFFLYLVILNAGVVAVASQRRWTLVSWTGYLGTQGLFYLWYQSNYHPEKLGWTLGFQVILFCIYLVQSMMLSRLHQQRLSAWELALFVMNAIVSFFVFWLLLRDQYAYWLGSLSLFMATIYAILAKMNLAQQKVDTRLSMTSTAVAIGFVSSAIPLQAEAGWVSLLWAAIASGLWWFGLRVTMPWLRLLAGLLAVASVSRLLMMDLPLSIRDPFVPVFNREALPSIAVAVCILVSVVLADRYWKRLVQGEAALVGIAGIVGLSLLWFLLSLECYGYFLSQSIGSETPNIETWRWRGQLALTIFWAIFATGILVGGFRFDRARLRWFAIVVYGAAVIKIFMIDMANVQQLYRILVFFVLAVVLGLVARTYQRIQQKANL